MLASLPELATSAPASGVEDFLPQPAIKAVDKNVAVSRPYIFIF